MDLRESVVIDLCRFEWMNMRVFLEDLEGKMSGFRNEFCESR